MQVLIRTLALALTTFAMAVGPAAAQGHSHGGGGGRGGWGGHAGGYHGGGYHGGWAGHGWSRHGGHGWGWGGLGLGLGLGIGLGSYYYGAPWYPGYVVPVAPPVYDVETVPSQPVVSAPDPVIYPRNGQSPTQTEADRQACNRWATTQPSALADATVFQRAVAACMDAHGYTVR